MSNKKKYSVYLTDEQAEAIKKLLDINVNEMQNKENTFPKLGDRYSIITSRGEICYDFEWDNSKNDQTFLSIGNCFKTKEEAEFELERLKVLAKMKKFAEPKDANWYHTKDHYYITYNHNVDIIVIESHPIFKHGCMYFESEEKAKECIEAIGEDRIKKYYLGITYGHPIE